VPEASAARAERPTPVPVVAGDVAPPARRRTAGLRPGNHALLREKPPLLIRAAELVGRIGDDPDLRELVYATTEAVRRKQLRPHTGKLLLERMLPQVRHAGVVLPPIHSAAALACAHDLIIRALSDGRLSPAEARDAQAVVRSAWQAHLTAEIHGEEEQAAAERNRRRR
jgi:hypothetical protein